MKFFPICQGKSVFNFTQLLQDSLSFKKLFFMTKLRMSNGNFLLLKSLIHYDGGLHRGAFCSVLNFVQLDI